MTKSNFISNIKQLSLGYITAFVASFMLYIYEPILTYSANIDDFWFDFSLMLSNIILYSIITFIGISFLYTIIYIIANKILKKENIYNIFLVISWIIFICTYIQGNYLTGSLPVLDGTTINWNDFFIQNVISVAILVVLVIGEIFAIKKLSIKKIVKINTYITLAVLAMLLTSFISILCTPNLFKDKTIATATNKNLNAVSSDKNFFIFLVDAVDSGGFNEVLKETTEYNQTFEDFTYYPDTISGYEYTRDSIPFILSGKWNKNEKEFTEFFNESFSNSEFFENLRKENYNMNFYEEYDNFCNEKNANMFDNMIVYNDKIDKTIFLKQLTKYLLFKYLPYQFKPYSKIQTADFNLCKKNDEEEVENYNWGNVKQYNLLQNMQIDSKKDKIFKFIHVEGGHVPFNLDENLNEISEESGTYEMKLKATLKLVNEFIQTLKQNNVYNNSVIIVMADHGYWRKTGRQNPILFIKGIDEHHNMMTSDIPVSYEDLIDAYKQLLKDEQSTQLFQNVDKSRIRKFFDNGNNIMREREVRGNSWDNYEITETGIEYK